MKKILIVGQCPSKRGEGKPALCGPDGSGGKLAQLAGVTIDEMHERADCVNLLSGNYSHSNYPKDLAQAAAGKIPVYLYRYVLMLGQHVARAFGFKHFYWLHEYRSRGVIFVVVPHPSGLNHWYNETQHVESAKDKLRHIFAQNY